MLSNETSQMLSGVTNLNGAKMEDLRALQSIWDAPLSKVEFEDKRMCEQKIQRCAYCKYL